MAASPATIDGHSSVERIFGYKRYETKEEFSKAYDTLIKEALSLCGNRA